MAPTETAFLPLDARFTTLFVSPEILRPVAQSRASVTAPIAPSASPSDVDLFESPADATVRFHLPRLRIRTDATSYDLRLAPEDGGWSIRFGIEPYPAPELGDGARTTALAFALPDAALEYAAPPLSRRLVASEIIPDAGGWTIGFHTDLPGKDEVLWALASEGGIRLVVSRSFTVALPEASVAPRPPIGKIAMLGNRFLLQQVVERAPIPEPPPQVDPTPPPPVSPEPVRDFGGIARRVGRTPFVARRIGDVSAAVVSAAATDTRIAGLGNRRFDNVFRPGDDRIVFNPGHIFQPVDDSPTVEILYYPTTLNQPVVLPLRLEPAAHPGIFAGQAAAAPRFRALRVSFPAGAGGRSHLYFQDQNRPATFYFLPDLFCLDRTDTAPLRPAVMFQVDQGEAEAEAKAAVTFRLVPRLDHDRIDAARSQLAAFIPPPAAGESAPAVELAPVQAAAELTLGLPDGAELKLPPLDLINGFMAQAVFPFDTFQNVFAAMASGQELGTLLRGNVDVTIPGDDGPNPGHALIPVDLRFSAADNAVLSAHEAPTADGGITLTLRNESESPARIDELPLQLSRGGAPVPAAAPSLHLPLVLAADEETSFEVTSAAPPTGDGDLDVLADLAHVSPLPDPTAILALTLDDQIAQTSEREVTVVIPRSKLAGVDPPRTVFVEFAGSTEPVELDATTPQVKAKVPVPLADILLRRDAAPYRYRQTVLRDSGEQRDTDWRTSDSGILTVPVT